MNLRKYLVLLLGTLLLFACMTTGYAEDAAQGDQALIDLLTTIKIGSNTYSIIAPLEEVEAQGITITAEERKLDSWLMANNGRATFNVKLSGTNGDSSKLSVCGVEINPDGNQKFELYGGIVLGPEPSTREQVLAVYGRPFASTNVAVTYSFFSDKMRYSIYFNDDNTIRRIEIKSDLPMAYGFEYSDLAGKADENLPDPKTMAFDEYIVEGKFYKGEMMLQDLVDDGWLLDSAIDPNEEVEPKGESRVITLFNGKCTLQLQLINRSADTPCKLSECGIVYFDVSKVGNASIVLADGITIGSPYADVVALFGEANRMSDHSSYSDDIYYEHTVMGYRLYCFYVYADNGAVKTIRVYP